MELLLRDTVVWDIFQPYNTAQQYAASVCECLGLRFDWYRRIVDSVDALLVDIWEVCDSDGKLLRRWLLCAWLYCGVRHLSVQPAGPASPSSQPVQPARPASPSSQPVQPAHPASPRASS
jgi:SNF5 / SMARCB1 / INI1